MAKGRIVIIQTEDLTWKGSWFCLPARWRLPNDCVNIASEQLLPLARESCNLSGEEFALYIERECGCLLCRKCLLSVQTLLQRLDVKDRLRLRVLRQRPGSHRRTGDLLAARGECLRGYRGEGWRLHDSIKWKSMTQYVQSWPKKCVLGCVISQPRTHFFGQLCSKISSETCRIRSSCHPATCQTAGLL